MFERYTEPARRTIFFGRYEASQFGSPQIETEHLLLGLLRQDRALARRFLGSDSAGGKIYKTIQQRKRAGYEQQSSVDLPISNECKRVLSFAAVEADLLSTKHIGTEHLLLGLLREGRSLAANILNESGLNLEPTRNELIKRPHELPPEFLAIEDEQPMTETRALPEEIVEIQSHLRIIAKLMEKAVASHNFTKARFLSDEERKERDKLRQLFKQHGLDDWPPT